MKFLHVSDLHIGRRLLGKSLAEDQKHILNQILIMAARDDVDAVLVAGDLYDKNQPSSEAVEMTDAFLSSLAALHKPCFIVSGNHDCAEQVAYCRGILRDARMYVSPAFNSVPERHVLQDEHGEIHVYLLPFIRPSVVRRAFPGRAEEIKGYPDAMRVVLEEMDIDKTVRNVLVAHQFITGGMDPELTDSEERMVGGVDAIPAALFENFDYVALGHLHSPQRVKGDRIRYAGSPLKYSLSEEKQRKAALLVEIGAKNHDLHVDALPFEPVRDLKGLRGTLAELTDGVFDKDYVFVTLTDEFPPLDAAGSLLLSYPNLVQLRTENSRSMEKSTPMALESVEERSPLEHFVHFYALQNNDQLPTEKQMQLLKILIEEAEEDLYASN